MDVIIRRAQIHDIPDILQLNDEFNGVGLSTVESMKQSLENNKNEIVFVAVCNEKAVGFICGQLYSSICYSNSMQCEITELFVKENYRNKGIASMLMEQLEHEFIKNNANEIVLVTGINNLKAQKFYEKCGYVHEGNAYFKTQKI